MKIIDLTPEFENLYFVCLEDWSDEMKEAADHKAKWYSQMKSKGLRVKLAQDSDGVICGMIQYIPIQYSFVKGEDLYFVMCIWVHGHKEGIGDYRKRGFGKALIAAAEEDVRSLGSKGLAVWGLVIPAFMQASWFKKQGYIKADRTGITLLLWKSFHDDAKPPKMIKPNKKVGKIDGQVTVYAFKYGWCPVYNLTYERIKRVCSEFSDKVVLKEFDTTNESLYKEWGIRDALFLDTKEVRTGPPPSYDKLYKLVEKQVRKL